jgi:hypothetical protein
MRYILGILICSLLGSPIIFAPQITVGNFQGETTEIPHLVSTLTPGQEEFEELLQTNNGCALPCWWGFTVGVSGEDDWFDFLDSRSFHVFREEPIGDKIVPVDYAYFSFPHASDTAVTINYTFSNTILSQLKIILRNPRAWLSPSVDAITLPHLLAQLEEQPEVYVFSRSSPLDYGIILIDSSIGLMANYTFDFWEVQTNQENYPQELSICLSMAYTTRIEITLQAPNVEPPLGARERPEIHAQERQTYIPVEEATFGRINADEFVTFFREHPDECLNISFRTLGDSQ